MYSFYQLKDIVSEKIENLSFTKKEPTELYQPISYLLSIGGKRIRPVLTLMSVDMFEGDVLKAVNPAVGIEMFHNFTLMHDDIMDKANHRRGQITVHKKWNENTAILSGDAMLLLANQMMLEVDDDILREVMVLYNNTGLLVCDGQQYDMNFEKRNNITTEEYLKMIELKTAVLLGGCLKLGAVLARTSENIKELIEQFGINLGISFQIEDDFLDAFGDFEKFGKSIGGDIIINKKTFLLVKALEMAKGEELKELRSWLLKSSFVPEEKINQITNIYRKLKIDQMALDCSRKYFQKAMGILADIDVKDKNKKTLYEFAHLLIGRKS